MADITPRHLGTLGDDRKAYYAGLDARENHDTPEGSTKNPHDARHKALIEEAMKRFKITAEAESEQRARELEDLQFDRALEADQWPQKILDERKGDGRTTAAKPCLTIPKLTQPILQTVNEGKSARLGIRIKAKGNGADDDGATLRQGLIRAIEVNCNAAAARYWAFERAVKCGRGFYRVLKTYANDGPFHDVNGVPDIDSEVYDLDLTVSRILNQFSVYFDPFAKEPDWSDAEWCFITEDVPKDEFKRKYPKSKLATASSQELSSLGDSAAGWIGNEAFRVAEYYYVEHETKTLYYDSKTGEKRWLKDDEQGPFDPHIKTRQVDVRTVKWCVITAMDVLDEEDWQGRFIPVIPVIGMEYNVNGKRCFKGIVSNAKDAQRSYNYFRSSQVEMTALARSAPWIMAEGQDEGYEAQWDRANVDNRTRLIYRPTSFEGHLVPPPQRNVAEPAIEAITIMVREADNDIKSTTGRFDPSLGAISSSERSGKAIQKLQEQGERGSSNYLDNLASISMVLEGKILLDLLPIVYDRPGRIARVLGDEEGDERQVMLGAPFVEGPDGAPVPVPAGMPPGAPGMMPQGQMAPGQPPTPPQEPQEYDLSQGVYSVVVSVGPSTKTQREENVALLTSMLESVPDPEFAKIIMPILAKNLEGPAAQELSDALSPHGPDGEKIPPQVQAHVAKLEQQLQEVTAAAQQMDQALKSKQMDLDKEAQIKMQEMRFKHELEVMKIRSAIATIRAKVDGDASIAEIEAALKRMEQFAEQQHETQMQQTEIAAEMTMQARELAAKERLQERQAEVAAEGDERKAVLGEAQRQNTVQDSRQDAAIDASRQSSEAEKDRQAAERQSQLKAAQKPKSDA
jgi:hypothetical protein